MCQVVNSRVLPSVWVDSVAEMILNKVPLQSLQKAFFFPMSSCVLERVKENRWGHLPLYFYKTKIFSPEVAYLHDFRRFQFFFRGSAFCSKLIHQGICRVDSNFGRFLNRIKKNSSVLNSLRWRGSPTIIKRFLKTALRGDCRTR